MWSIWLIWIMVKTIHLHEGTSPVGYSDWTPPSPIIDMFSPLRNLPPFHISPTPEPSWWVEQGGEVWDFCNVWLIAGLISRLSNVALKRPVHFASPSTQWSRRKDSHPYLKPSLQETVPSLQAVVMLVGVTPVSDQEHQFLQREQKNTVKWGDPTLIQTRWRFTCVQC